MLIVKLSNGRPAQVVREASYKIEENAIDPVYQDLEDCQNNLKQARRGGMVFAFATFVFGGLVLSRG